MGSKPTLVATYKDAGKCTRSVGLEVVSGWMREQFALLLCANHGQYRLGMLACVWHHVCWSGSQAVH